MIRNVSDTALMGAGYRARESLRPDALSVDPLAHLLAGERGRRLSSQGAASTGWLVRTKLIDAIILREVWGGAGPVVSIGAGLDTRPYRLPLPRRLDWIEIDLPGVIAHKRRVLADERPRCRIKRIALDIERARERRQLLFQIGSGGRAIALTEGVLIYLRPHNVSALATELAASHFDGWILDVVSPVARRAVLRSAIGRSLERGGAALRFAPPIGLKFFRARGWNVVMARSVLRAASRFGRISVRTERLLRRAGVLVRVCLLRRSRSYGAPNNPVIAWGVGVP